MSGFSDIALPGRIPSVRTDGYLDVTPDSLFSKARSYERRRGFFPDSTEEGAFSVSKVKVEIFDMSDKAQRRNYERLWRTLLEKVYKGEAVVEASKDLVHRPDGTSYWQKYVEYVVFGPLKKARSSKEAEENGQKNNG